MTFSFSASAPVVTAEQELAEVQALEEDERRELEANLHPDSEVNDVVFPEASESALENAVQMMKEALEQMPVAEKASFTQALESAPELVETESNFRAFLKAERVDAWAAARRLVSYWKLRKRLFGSRAFLPMTLDGAMAPDRGTLEKGVIIPLPPDRFGRPVIYVDRNRIKKGGCVTVDSIIRCRFYIHTIVANSDAAQRLGHVTIIDVRDYGLYTHSERSYGKAVVAILESTPSKLATVHVVLRPRYAIFVDVVMPVAKFLMGKRWRHRLVVHTKYETEVVHDLEELGIAKENIPRNLTGKLDEDYFQHWLKQQATESSD